MTPQTPPKPYLSYAALTSLLDERGMQLDDQSRAERKLAQVGYYRLSGFWFPCREFARDGLGNVLCSPGSQKPLRQDVFRPGTRFDSVFELYLFDKKLRQLMLDAIERIEIFGRSVIAHELGRHDPLAYQQVGFINPRQTETYVDRKGRKRNIWTEWRQRQADLLTRSREDCIEWHRRNHKAIPFWVVVETWDFGTFSKYFEMLNGSHQNRISRRLGVRNPKVLKDWLQAINTLRNRCAHHSRIWNQVSSNPLPVMAGEPYFQALPLDANAMCRLFGLVTVIWYLLKNIGSNSQWLMKVAEVINSKPDLPGCTFGAIGLVDESGFPGAAFGI